MADDIKSQTAKATIHDTDEFLINDVENSNVDKKVTGATVKTKSLENKLDDLTAPDDNTDLDATTSKHGLMPKADKVKLDAIETAADVTDATNVAAAGATMDADTDVSSNGYVLDEDDMASDSATKLATQQSIKAYADNLHRKIGCSLSKSSDQTLANNVAEAIEFDGENWDTDAFHDNSTNNTRITIPTGLGGLYVFFTSLTYGSSSTSQRITRIYVNGSEVARDRTQAIFNSESMRMFMLDLSAGDYVELYGHQGSGGDLDVLGNIHTTFECQRLSDS